VYVCASVNAFDFVCVHVCFHLHVFVCVCVCVCVSVTARAMRVCMCISIHVYLQWCVCSYCVYLLATLCHQQRRLIRFTYIFSHTQIISNATLTTPDSRPSWPYPGPLSLWQCFYSITQALSWSFIHYGGVFTASPRPYPGPLSLWQCFPTSVSYYCGSQPFAAPNIS